MKPICDDLFCGLGGWAEGFLAEGYRVRGYDIEAHNYGTGGYPGEFHLRDARQMHGRELKDAAVIVASPPCTEYSYMAMPWSRAKQIARALEGKDVFPEGYTGSRTIEELNLLFNECFRLQREAIEAAGHFIPLIVENVRGAQKWVGRVRWNYGSFYLWGDVPALMPMTLKAQNGRKGVPHRTKGHWTNPAEHEDAAIKLGGSWFHEYRKGQGPRNHGSKSMKRKAASAMIAKIPLPLASYIARCYKPSVVAPLSRDLGGRL